MELLLEEFGDTVGLLGFVGLVEDFFSLEPFKTGGEASFADEIFGEVFETSFVEGAVVGAVVGAEAEIEAGVEAGVGSEGKTGAVVVSAVVGNVVVEDGSLFMDNFFGSLLSEFGSVDGATTTAVDWLEAAAAKALLAAEA